MVLKPTTLQHISNQCNRAENFSSKNVGDSRGEGPDLIAMEIEADLGAPDSESGVLIIEEHQYKTPRLFLLAAIKGRLHYSDAPFFAVNELLVGTPHVVAV
ncbi:Hypothetical predicted protein [Xyrichtys novacula]|uniref:Uncharacterized protein n=1 Tax=Xyrichtys novacula TaxID=13765 RepID=A0AAV1FND7_XYRNO|nr:Hypothetical predicted protein [Xyrichtys novacula]